MQRPTDSTVMFVSGGNPLRGMSSSLDASTLPADMLQLGENIRLDRGLPEVRGGTALIYAAPSGSNLVYKGGMIHPDLGAFVAVYEPAASKTKIYQYTGGAWVERTDATSRMANADVAFMVVQESPISTGIAPWNVPGTRYVVAQNGSEAPRVMVEGGTLFYNHSAIATSEPSKYRAQIYYNQFYQFGKEDSGRTPNGITSVTESDATKVEGNIENLGLTTQYVSVAIKTAAASYDATTTIDFSSTVNFGTNKWFHVLFNATSGSQAPYTQHPDIWENLKLEATDGSTTVVIYDPTDAAYARPVIAENNAGNLLAGFLIPSGLSSTNLDKIRLTWKGGQLASEITLSLYAMMATLGDVPGGSSFAVSHFDTTTRAESASVVCTNEDNPNAKSFGAPLIEGMEIPISPGIGYAYRIIDPLTTGGDYRCVYVATPEQEDFYFVTSGSVGSTTYVNSAIQYPILAPGGLHKEMPVASVVRAVGGRALCSGGNTKGLWFSALGFPFRFRPTLEFTDGDPSINGAGTTMFQGETIQAIEPLAGAFASNESSLIWTNLALYRCDGSDSFQLTRPRKVAEHGTLSPKSVAMYNGAAYWLDSDRQVRSYGPGFSVPSMNTIERELLDIPDARIDDVQGAIWRDAYYLAYTPSGGSANTKLFVWDMRVQGWCRYSFPVSGGAVATMPGIFSGKQKLCVWSSVGGLYEFDKPASDDLGTNVTVDMWFRELTNEYFNALAVKRVGVVCSTGSGSLTVTRYARDTTDPATTTISLSSTTVRESGGGLAWRYDADASGVQGGTLKDWGVSVRLSGQVAPGWKLLACQADVTPVAGGADV